MKVIDQKKIRSQVVIQSFDIRTLQILHQKYPGVKTSMLIEPAELTGITAKIKKLGFVPDVVSPEYHMVSAGMVNEMHKANMKIIPWTVNDTTSINKLKSIGVDGIISDYPDLLQ
jgi:glycerophosphoryl diester phosphodiesterase